MVVFCKVSLYESYPQSNLCNPKACHEHVQNLHYIVKCKCAILKEQAEEQAKRMINTNTMITLKMCMLVENSARMPQGNGSIIGSGVPSVIGRYGPHSEMTTPLLDNQTLFTRL